MPGAEHTSEKLQTARELFAQWLGASKNFVSFCALHPAFTSELQELHFTFQLGQAAAASHTFQQTLREHFGEDAEVTVKLEDGFGVPPSAGAAHEPAKAGTPSGGTRYALEGEVARGGMGVIFRVRDRDLSRTLAMKVMTGARPITSLSHRMGEGHGEGAKDASSRLGLARFLEEAQVTAQLDHPGIVPVHEVGFDAQGQPFFTMKLVKGRDLNEIFKLARAGEGWSKPAANKVGRGTPCAPLGVPPSGGPDRVNAGHETADGAHGVTRPTQQSSQTEPENWNLPRAVGVIVKACQALAYAHTKGVIHRDLKPANIMVGRFGEVFVMDWGLAKITGKKDLHDIRPKDTQLTSASVHSKRRDDADSTPDSPLITMDGSVVGTPAYMPPEQARGQVEQVDAISDIYSLGAILYNLLTGQAPYVEPGARISPHTILARVLDGPPKRIHTLNPKAPAELVAICEKAMAREKRDRYVSSLDLAEDLQAYLDNRVVKAYRTGAVAEFTSWVARNRGTAFAVVGLITSIVAFSVLFGVHQHRTAATLRTSLAGEYLRRGQSLCLEGKVTEGLHWLVRSLQQSPADQTNLIAVIRQNLGGWSAARNRPVSIVYQKALLYAAAFSPIEDRVVLGGMENSAQIYSASTGEPIDRVMPHHSSVNQAMFSPDGRFVATSDGQAWLWFADDGRPAWASPGSAHGVTSVAFSPDSRRLLVAGTNGTAQQWSVETGQAIGPPLKHEASVSHARYSGDGRWIATGGLDKTARLWSAETGEPARPALRHDEALFQVAFSPDGRTLATMGVNRTVWLWSVGNGELIAPPLHHDGVVKAFAFSPDSQHLLTGGEDGFARLWNLRGEPVGSLMRHENGVLTVAFTPDGRRVLTGGRDRTARFWSAETGEPLGQPLEHDSWVAEIHFSRDGSKVLTRTYGHSAAVWSANLGTAPDVELKEQPLLAGVFSPDGKRVLTGNILGEARVWSAETGEPTGLVVKHPMFNVAYSPDGQLFLTAGRDGLVKFWSAATGEPLGQPLTHSKTVRAAVFSHDGKRVAAACFDKTARVWSVATRQQIGEPLVHPEIVEDIDFSPDDARVVTAGSDGRALVWSVATGKLALPPLEHRSAVLGAVFSPDGRFILTGSRDTTARLWDAATGKPVGPPMQHPDWVEEVVFSPDGRMILTGSNDGRARLWSAATGQLLGPPVPNHGPLMDVQFSPDGKHAIASSQAKAFWVAQGSAFRGAKIWRIPEPFNGRVEAANHWVQALTGMTLDERGVLSWLDHATWKARRDELEKLGGPALR